jgi:hypothetical protein
MDMGLQCSGGDSDCGGEECSVLRHAWLQSRAVMRCSTSCSTKDAPRYRNGVVDGSMGRAAQLQMAQCTSGRVAGPAEAVQSSRQCDQEALQKGAGEQSRSRLN